MRVDLAAAAAGGERSDEALVAAFVEGDQRAFDALVDRYEQRVFAICHRYFGNPTDAEDATQDAFIALLRRAQTYAGTASFSTWMYRVATNACNDLARKRARRPRSVDADVSAVAEERQASPSAEETLAARGLDADLLAALRALDTATREAIVLHDVYGVAYAEIAERDGIAVGTVKSRVHRGHARVAATLGRATEPSDQSRPPTTSP